MTETSCASAILDLLTLYPDCEMRVADVWQELDQKWQQAIVQDTLETLVCSGRVLRLNDDGKFWYSVAMTKLPNMD